VLPRPNLYRHRRHRGRAAYLDKALDTTAFVAGANAGSLSASWTLTESS
jgi:hypothetical protein